MQMCIIIIWMYSYSFELGKSVSLWMVKRGTQVFQNTHSVSSRHGKKWG